jgi:ribosomal protein RSM22 (predicted rRNA methylase)
VVLILPSKVPPSYSIVATGVPAQWNLTEFEVDIKKQYPTIVKVERLLIKGGIPISKVRIDFSSDQEVNKIMKNKRLLLDDTNTSFAIQPYSPPFKVLRCFNCQQYNDHIAANCPHKNNPNCPAKIEENIK